MQSVSTKQPGNHNFDLVSIITIYVDSIQLCYYHVNKIPSQVLMMRALVLLKGTSLKEWLREIL